MNGVRLGAGHCEMKLPVVDDRLFYNVMDVFEEDAGKHLANVVAASDLG